MDACFAPPAAGDDAREPAGDWLLAHPAVIVAHLEKEFAVLHDPRTDTALRLTRPVYEVFRHFHYPAPAEGAAPREEGPRRERVLACVRQLRERGFLAPLAEVLASAGVAGR